MQMSRVLMCREHPVLEFRYFATGGYIVEVGEVLDAARLPLGMYVDGRPEPTGESASAWWRSRGVPMTRDGLGKVLAGMGVATSADLLDRSMGLSLSDQYWVRPIERDDLTWADLNFFHHDFDGQLGKALFLGNASKVDEMNTPDVTSAGDLPKRWIIADDGARQLVKAGRTGQEPDNERIATLVAQLLGIAHVEYRVGAMHGTRVSVCDEMLTDTEEIVAGGAIRHIFREGTRQEGKQIWLDACERLGVARVEAERAIDDFLLLDFLLRNTDRHYNNFGLIRDVESLAVRPAPIFDSGESLWNGMDPDAIDNADYPAKPFWLDDAGSGTTPSGSFPSSATGPAGIWTHSTRFPPSPERNWKPTAVYPPGSSTLSAPPCPSASPSSAARPEDCNGDFLAKRLLGQIHKTYEPRFRQSLFRSGIGVRLGSE